MKSLKSNVRLIMNFFNYEDLDEYQPSLNLTFYLEQNRSMYTMIDQMYLNEIKDLRIDKNERLKMAKRSISYKNSNR